MHICVALHTLGELFGMSSQCTNTTSPSDAHTTSSPLHLPRPFIFIFVLSITEHGPDN